MSGLQLTGMEASDMLDVIHYLFEDDMRFTSGEMADAVTKSRTSLYEQMYGTTYIFSGVSSNSQSRYASGPSTFDNFDDVKPYDPTKKKTKPYIPATKVDPDSGMLMDTSGLLEPPLR